MWRKVSIERRKKKTKQTESIHKADDKRMKWKCIRIGTGVDKAIEGEKVVRYMEESEVHRGMGKKHS